MQISIYEFASFAWLSYEIDRRVKAILQEGLSLEILSEIFHPSEFHFGHQGKGWECWR